MTPLREELARAINKTRPPTCDHPQCSCTYECERHDDMADSYLDAVDAILPILTREVAAARKAAIEEAAKCAEDVPVECYASDPYIRQTKHTRTTIAAAIRKLGEG